MKGERELWLEMRVEELERELSLEHASGVQCEATVRRATAAEKRVEQQNQALTGLANEIRRLRDIISPGDAAAYEQGMAALQAKLARLEGLYSALLLAVAQKYPGETRHETALRYIVEREKRASETGEAKESRIRAQREEGKP